jgi:hypothetical protein
MAPHASADEWRALEALLPPGWQDAARSLGAFRRARYVNDPGIVLRLLLFHAVSGGGLRETVAQARLSGLVSMSQVALLKRLRTCGPWLAWLGAGLCTRLRDQPRVPNGLRPRVIDSTTVQGPASKGTQWRLHYSLDLSTTTCDWYELTDAYGAELLERVPMRSGDLLLADRNYLRSPAVAAAVKVGAHLLIRMRWRHPRMHDAKGRPFNALDHARRLKVGQTAEWPVRLSEAGSPAAAGRVVAIRLPAPLAARALRRIRRTASRKRRKPNPRSLQAAPFIFAFTTLPVAMLDAAGVLELYRVRWQIELAFKRLKQLLSLGRLPHKDPRAAQAWILAKLVISLLLETLYRNARAISPWGYRIEQLQERPA